MVDIGSGHRVRPQALVIILLPLLLELAQVTVATEISVQQPEGGAGDFLERARPKTRRSSDTRDDYMSAAPQDSSSSSSGNCYGQSHLPQYSECPLHKCSSNRDCNDPQLRCTCDPALCGQVCLSFNAECPFLTEPRKGTKKRQFPEKNENAVGQSVTYRCASGYTLEGEVDTVTCQANYRWSHAAPRCTGVEYCNPPPQIPNTVMEPSLLDSRQYQSGDEVRYSCAPGFRSEKPGLWVTSVCTKGHWNMHRFVCSIISCGHPGNLSNGRHLNRNYTYNHKVSYFCNEGFTLKCSEPEENAKSDTGCQVRTCGADGRWSGSMPVCKPILCPMLENPPNGQVTRGWNTVNSVVQYTCNVGYRIEGASSRMCRRDGRWDGSEPRCAVQDCGPPPFVANAYRVQLSSTKYNAKVAYTCMPDTKLEGENGGQIVCQREGRWVPAPPKCRKHCTAPLVPRGTALIGRPDGPPAVGKVPSDTTLWIRCDDNYQLERTLYPRCDNDTWTRIPVCVPKDCNDRPPLVKSGIARFYSTRHNDRVIYSCYVGYEVIRGSSLLTCQFGRWVGTPPTCGKKKCPWIDSSPGVEKWLIGPEGIKNQWTRPQTTSDNEELVQFQCIGKGRVLRGHTHAICLNGEWRPPGSPECVPQMHKQIPHDWLFYRVGRK